MFTTRVNVGAVEFDEACALDLTYDWKKKKKVSPILIGPYCKCY